MQHFDPRISLNTSSVAKSADYDKIFYYISYKHLKENYCKDSEDLYECIMAYRGDPNHMRYKMFFGFSSFYKSQVITSSINAFNFSVFSIGVWAYFKNRFLEVEALFALGLVAASLHLFEVSDQVCDEYSEYLAFVTAITKGERDYTKLGKQFGLAPGIFFQYLHLHALHQVSDYAEHLVKFLHQILHQVTLWGIYYLGASHFKSRPDLAQMLAFALVSSPDQRWFYSQLHSEEILVFYVILSMVFIVKRKVMMASVMIGFSFALSPAYIAYLPTFLATVKREFGTSKMVLGLILIINIQVMAALPFTILGPTSVSDYLEAVARTGTSTL